MSLIELGIDLGVLAYDTLSEMVRRAHSDDPSDNLPPTPVNTQNVAEVIATAATGYTMSKEGRIELANYEALANTKYIDSGGVHTIGIGMTVSEIHDLVQWPWGRFVSTEQCVKDFNGALVKYEYAVNHALKVDVTQNQFDALVSITYNIGRAGMANSTFMRRLNAKADPKDVVAAVQNWKMDNGKEVKGLKIRRAAEGQVFLTGHYLNNGTVAQILVNPNTHKPSYKGRVNIAQYM